MPSFQRRIRDFVICFQLGGVLRFYDYDRSKYYNSNVLEFMDREMMHVGSELKVLLVWLYRRRCKDEWFDNPYKLSCFIANECTTCNMPIHRILKMSTP